MRTVGIDVLSGIVWDRYGDRAVVTFREAIGGDDVIRYQARSVDVPPLLQLEWTVNDGTSLYGWRRRRTQRCDRCGQPNGRDHLLEFVNAANQSVAHVLRFEQLWHECTAEEVPSG